jgi:hypothetical protein
VQRESLFALEIYNNGIPLQFHCFSRRDRGIGYKRLGTDAKGSHLTGRCGASHGRGEIRAHRFLPPPDPQNPTRLIYKRAFFGVWG